MTSPLKTIECKYRHDSTSFLTPDNFVMSIDKKFNSIRSIKQNPLEKLKGNSLSEN